MYQFLNCYQFMEVPQALVSSIKVHLLHKNNLNYLTRWNIPPSVNCNKVILIIETSACGKFQIFILFFRHMTQYDSVTFFSMVNSVKWVFCNLKKNEFWHVLCKFWFPDFNLYWFHVCIPNCRTNEKAFGQNTGWLFLDAADSLFVVMSFTMIP